MVQLKDVLVCSLDLTMSAQMNFIFITTQVNVEPTSPRIARTPDPGPRTVLKIQISGHHGLLEYFNFEAVDPLRHPHCMTIPEDPSDFNWQTPSHWDSQNHLNQDRDQSGPRPPVF